MTLFGMVSIYFVFALVTTYPIKRFVKFIFSKMGFRHKSLFIGSFITSLLLSIIYILLMSTTTITQALTFAVFSVLSLGYWLALDFAGLNQDAKFIKFLNNKVFRVSFGFVVFLIVFSISMGLFKLDIYYITPLLATILYMVFVYRRPKGRRRLAPGEYVIKPEGKRL